MKTEVTKCVCSEITFEEMKSLMDRNNLKTFEELSREIKVASNCRLCLPYIHRMIETGKTKFEIISD
jgi:bacterioferritin-associated ferredoxin